MSLDTDWTIMFCAGYIVPPSKHVSKLTDVLVTIEGSTFDLNPSTHRYFYPRFVSSPTSCTIEIGFTHTDGVQQNDVRDLIRKMAFGDNDVRASASHTLAARLGHATDRRSPAGLFVSLVGENGQSRRVVFFKFPADESLQATFAEEGLSINVIEGAFSRKTDFFKAAVYEGRDTDTALWGGRVEDKQSGSRIHEVSDYWVMGFLRSVPQLTTARGTRLLTKALKTTINKSEDPDEQYALMAAATAIKSQADRNITLREFTEGYLPEAIRERFLREVGNPTLADAPFRIDESVLDQQLAFRTIVLHNRFSVSGPPEGFQNPDIFTQVDSVDSGVALTIRGRIVDQKLRART